MQTSLEKLRQKCEEVENEHFAELEQSRAADFEQAFINHAFEIRGAIRAVNAIASNLMSQHIRGLMRVEEEKLWRVYGFISFADYLNNADEVGMSKTRYYELKDILLETNPETLDAITGAKISPRKIKLLLDNNVPFSVENGSILIGDERVAANDADAVTQLVEHFHTALKERDRREEKLQKAVEKQEETIRTAYQDIDRLRASRSAEVSGDPHSMAFASLGFAFTALREQAALLSDVDRAARRDNVLEILANQMQLTREAYGSGPVRANAVTGPAAGQSFDEFLAAGLDAIDLHAVDVDDNDAELAAAL